MRTKPLALVLLVWTANMALADDDGLAFFEKKIRPVLAEQCYSCHGEKKQRGGLALHTKEALLAGGDSGPSLAPGDAVKSLLLKAVRYEDPDLQMPPKGQLPAQVIADLERWVKMGAPDPRSDGGKVAKAYGIDIEEGRKFWAYQPPKKATLPEPKLPGWARGEVDRYLLAGLERQGIRPTGDADRETLVRRAYYALTGLPPSPEQIDAFVNDSSSDAFAKVVDGLLASPHFGERWGRHWLDVARYADSSGGGRSLLFTEAWRYRDYVVNAFNADKPYNQFVMEQVAGDLLPAASEEERQWRLIALAYLMLGPINYEEQDKPVLEVDIIDEQLDAIGRGFLGMTIGCARCHDHKFDPIPTADYYAMAGVLRSTHFINHSNVSAWVENPLPVSGELAAAIKKHEEQVAGLKKQIQRAKAELKKAGVSLAASGVVAVDDLPGLVIDDTQAKKVGKWSPSRFQDTYVGDGYLFSGKGQNTLTFVPKIEKEGFYEVRLAYLPYTNRATNTYVRILHTDGEADLRINQKETPPVDGRWLSLGKFRFEKGDQWFVLVSTQDANGSVVADAVQFLHEDDLNPAPRAVKADAPKADAPKYDLKRLEAELKQLEAKAPRRPMAMGVKEAANPGDFYVCVRGNIHNKGPQVKRGFLQVATDGPMPTIPAGQSGRLQLAEWLASERNPLTARVMVNRIWHHLFGYGIVKSVDNFGTTGDLPSNPELLDYLAVRFVEQGWSVKQLIREVMLSRAYQMASRVDADDPATRQAVAADVDNRLFWRQNRHRLEAEAIRDTILQVSGQLDRTVGGPAFRGNVASERDFKFTDTRRSVYTPIFRNNLLELFEAFDFPDPNLVKGARAASTVAPQALYLMNSPFAMEQSKVAAGRTLADTDADDAGRLDRAYRTALGRLPTARERELALEYLREAGADDARREAWERLYQVLFACVDFRYVN